jgi:hypothetical protein
VTAIRSLADWNRIGPGVWDARIGNSRFEFLIDSGEDEFREACDVALRLNPARRFLFVSRVLGRHWPTRPATLRLVADRLARSIAFNFGDRRLLIVGMSETATALGQAVFAAARLRGAKASYVESTRRRTGAPVAFEFDEPHSHATRHAVHAPPGSASERSLRQAEAIVVVDDECTTGRTFTACVNAIEAWSGQRRDATLATILHWRIDNPPANLPMRVESLISGSFRFNPGPTESESVPSIPADAGAGKATLARVGPRHGLDEPESIAGARIARVRNGDRILVVGIGEFGYLPLLIAEQAERDGATAWLQATTRSPIKVGGAIVHARGFDAITGEGYREYLYNVPDNHSYDRVVLCTEEAGPPSGHPILRLPRLEVLS